MQEKLDTQLRISYEDISSRIERLRKTTDFQTPTPTRNRNDEELDYRKTSIVKNRMAKYQRLNT